MASMIQVLNLTFSYQRMKVLSQVTFTVKPGVFTGLLGSNGSGKTTILKCINGLLRPEKGEIYLEGQPLKDLKQQEMARIISMVFQEQHLTFSYPVLDVVLLGITPYLGFGKMPSKTHYQKAWTILEKMDILHLRERDYHHLSGGEKKLVFIARSLMQETPYVLMDEPTSHLDFKNQHELMQEVQKLTSRGKGILMTLHDPNLALRYCDQAILVKEGRILVMGRTEEVLTIPHLQETYGLDFTVEKTSQNDLVVLPVTRENGIR